MQTMEFLINESSRLKKIILAKIEAENSKQRGSENEQNKKD